MSKNEWYTPAKYIEAARSVMGSIDLDPASCAIAQETVKATRYYTSDDDGLSQEWNGRVWLNPPYGKIRNGGAGGGSSSYQQLFITKLLEEYASGRIEQAVLLLLGNVCYNRYFPPLWKYPVCFNSGHINFYKADGTSGSFGFGSLFVYLGPNEDKFLQAFSQFGTIARRVEPAA